MSWIWKQLFRFSTEARGVFILRTTKPRCGSTGAAVNGGKAAEAGSWRPNSTYCRGYELLGCISATPVSAQGQIYCTCYDIDVGDGGNDDDDKVEDYDNNNDNDNNNNDNDNNNNNNADCWQLSSKNYVTYSNSNERSGIA